MVTIKEKVFTDVLVIGGGGAACTAAVASAGKVQIRFWFPRERLETAEIQL